MDTKARILQTAVELFNASGTAVVSTNHIAAAAEISPGNLYYHYRNKEEIIRAIVEQIIAGWGNLWAQAQQAEPSPENMRASLLRNFTLLWDYRFFFRELILLMEHDPELKRRYQTARQQRVLELEALLNRYVAAGMLKPPENDDDFRMRITACMLINNQWLIEVEIEEGTLTQKQIERGIALFMYLLRPYLQYPISARRSAKRKGVKAP